MHWLGLYPLIGALVPAAQKDDPVLPVLCAVHSISSANVNPQFHHALANWLRVPKVSRFDLTQSHNNAGLGHFVSDCRDPVSERISPILLLVVDEFNHEISEA
jgi:hypothetical protein